MRFSRKRSRTSTIISEYAHDLLQEDVLDGSIRIDEGNGSGRFSLRECVSLSDEQITSLTKQADLITAFKNVAGHVVVSFSPRSDLQALVPSSASEVEAPPKATFSSEELCKVVRPCDVAKIEEIINHLLKCLPSVEDVKYRHETPLDRKLVVVLYILKLDSSSLRALRRHRDIAEIALYPHKKTTLAIEVSIRQ